MTTLCIVTTATRFRINQNSNILDLVLTNEEHMIPNGVTTESFSFQCYTKQKPKSHTTLMYHKADHDSMRQDLRQDWDMLFKNMSTNQMWSMLQNKINAAINKKALMLNPNKAPGPDNQHPCVFRELYDILDVPMLLIFRKSLEEGCLPESWKQAKITPINKKRIEKLVQQL